MFCVASLKQVAAFRSHSIKSIKTTLSRRSSAQPARAFTHVFGFSGALIKQHAAGGLDALDTCLTSNAFVASKWWTRWQARIFFQHDVPVPPSSGAAAAAAAFAAPATDTSISSLLKSSNASFDPESLVRQS